MRFFAALIATLLAAPAWAGGYGDFTGNWVNQDPSTNNLTRVTISQSSGLLRVRAWGQCHPADCDWGNVTAIAYSENVGGNPAADTQEVLAPFHSGFSDTNLMLRSRPGDTLSYTLYTRFTDTSHRAPYVVRGTLRRAGGYGGGGGGGGGPGGGYGGPAPEDCVGFNWSSVSVANVGGHWMVVDGGHQLLDFGGRFAEAARAVQIIKHYRFTDHCFIGRPNPHMDYWKTGTAVPSGITMGADCLTNNPDTTHAQYVGGEWKLVDGSNWLVSFGSREGEARNAEDIVHRYRLGHQCFIGRPNPSMTYWLSQ